MVPRNIHVHGVAVGIRVKNIMGGVPQNLHILRICRVTVIPEQVGQRCQNSWFLPCKRQAENIKTEKCGSLTRPAHFSFFYRP